MVILKYRKYDFVSIWWEYNMLCCENKMDIADIPCQKPNITEVAIN